MKIRTIVLAAATLGLGPAGWIVPQASAQPMWNVVKVTLPYSVTIGHKTLTPGDYTIQQLHTDGSTVLLFYNGTGMKFETSAMTVKALDLKTPENTAVILHRLGNDYYFDKIWIQGKDYGYEFPLPASVKSREKELASVSVSAEASTTATATDSTMPATDDSATPPAVDSTPVPPTTPEPVAIAPVTAPVAPEPVAVAPVTEVAPEPQASAIQQTPVVTDQPTDGTANREKKPASDDTNSQPDMPATSAGWLTMLLSGGTLSGAGMLLRRKR